MKNTPQWREFTVGGENSSYQVAFYPEEQSSIKIYNVDPIVYHDKIAWMGSHDGQTICVKGTGIQAIIVTQIEIYLRWGVHTELAVEYAGDLVSCIAVAVSRGYIRVKV